MYETMTEMNDNAISKSVTFKLLFWEHATDNDFSALQNIERFLEELIDYKSKLNLYFLLEYTI